jgi:beta-glucosidase
MEAYEKEHLKRIRKYLGECAVLLKSNGDFPLEAPGRIAAFGSGVRHTIKGGTGSGDAGTGSGTGSAGGSTGSSPSATTTTTNKS